MSQEKFVAEKEGFPSNSIFDELEDWEQQLRHLGIDFEELTNG